VLTFEIVDESGAARQFGSVFGGGRYDGLVERFTGQKMPATGSSIGVDRLLAALKALGKTDSTATTAHVLVTRLDQEPDDGVSADHGRASRRRVRSFAWYRNRA
jgi:histidyl-tRNA synthetase